MLNASSSHFDPEADIHAGSQYTPISLSPAMRSTAPSALRIIGVPQRMTSVVPTMAPNATATA